LLGGAVIQAARGEIFGPPDLGSLNVIGVANFGREEDADHNLVITVTSFLRPSQPGISFGPIPTSDFVRLFEYVSKGCLG
jgi:hypothetical protein